MVDPDSQPDASAGDPARPPVAGESDSGTASASESAFREATQVETADAQIGRAHV